MLAVRQIKPWPTSLDQRLFSVVKYSASGVKLAFSRILDAAHKLIATGGADREVCAKIIIDAWSLIDNARRMHKVIYTHRKKFREHALDNFITNYASLKTARDYAQHIDRHVDRRAVSTSFMGDLNFAHRLRDGEVSVYIIMAGTSRDRQPPTNAHPGYHVDFANTEVLSRFQFSVGNTAIILDDLAKECQEIANAIMDAIDSVASFRPGANEMAEDSMRDDLSVVLTATAMRAD